MKKLSKDELQQLINKAKELQIKNTDWRRGQSYFNALLDLHPETAEVMRGTYLDPFYEDSKVSPFLKHLSL